MISVFPLSQPNMLGFTLDGEVDEAGMEKFLMAVEAKVLTHQKIRLLGNIKSVGGFQSLQAFWSTLKTKKDLWDKIEKYAILTDHGWLASLTGGLEWLTPGIDVKTFRLSEGELAHDWLRLDPVEDPSQGLKEIDLGEPQVLGLAIIGKMTPQDYDRINLLIEAQARMYGQARILLEVVDAGFSGQQLIEDIKSGIKNYKNVERIALIGNQSWLKTTVKLGDLLTPGLELSAFSTAERKRAVAWLG
ncbi:STAS/SEC14 domain-containing protein [Lewinella sp. 4G2]|uniref:STAS/SEC14 domain-containing protein n=1 Tax=Lewinella sp. 4G2 TaxID=1803372 RepID=UPI0007B498BB|nr:STAS/SEC14 domain-containing protein [Lewinella sp. 4G2]OAV42588.1 hypothetical protein A3850_015185 [Lewinella sp. 4G2]